ncbi:hypothetical protein JCM14036_29370 [Desulfotomaculum defluvii]
MASGSNIHVYSPVNETYQKTAVVNLEQPILSLEVGFSPLGQNIIFVGTEDRIVAFANVSGVLTRLWQTDPEPGSKIVGMTLTDLDGDGREELAAIGSGNDTLYVYFFTGEDIIALRPQLLSIRQLPGTPRYISAFSPEPSRPKLLAIAYELNNASSIVTYFLTETGFDEGPGLVNLPYAILGLTAANLLPDPGDELVTAGNDGFVRIYSANDQFNLGIVTNNLGTVVSAVEAQLVTEDMSLLIAGTPGSYVFGFYSPGITKEPNWVFRAAGPINDLGIINQGRVMVGTVNGLLQVWEVKYPF